jgi:hypothetical protein
MPNNNELFYIAGAAAAWLFRGQIASALGITLPAAIAPAAPLAPVSSLDVSTDPWGEIVSNTGGYDTSYQTLAAAQAAAAQAAAQGLTALQQAQAAQAAANAAAAANQAAAAAQAATLTPAAQSTALQQIAQLKAAYPTASVTAAPVAAAPATACYGGQLWNGVFCYDDPTVSSAQLLAAQAIQNRINAGA